jgi:hypothetical protein
MTILDPCVSKILIQRLFGPIQGLLESDNLCNPITHLPVNRCDNLPAQQCALEQALELQTTLLAHTAKPQPKIQRRGWTVPACVTCTGKGTNLLGATKPAWHNSKPAPCQVLTSPQAHLKGVECTHTTKAQAWCTQAAACDDVRLFRHITLQ